MTKSDFLKKYPELDDNGDISAVKMKLLIGYSNHSISNQDEHVKTMLDDYKILKVCEKRNDKIDIILI